MKTEDSFFIGDCLLFVFRRHINNLFHQGGEIMNAQVYTSLRGQELSCFFPDERWELAKEIVSLSPISVYHIGKKLDEAIEHVYQQLIAADEMASTRKSKIAVS